MSFALPDVKLREVVSGWRNSCKPIGEFVNRKNHDMPKNFKIAARRLAKNVDYFHSNYLCVVMLLLVIQVVASPILLLVVALSAGSSIFILRQNVDRKIKIIGYEALLSTHTQLKILAIISVLAFWIVGGTFAIGWVTCLSVIFILAHGVTHNTEKDSQQSLVEEV